MGKEQWGSQFCCLWDAAPAISQLSSLTGLRVPSMVKQVIFLHKEKWSRETEILWLRENCANMCWFSLEGKATKAGSTWTRILEHTFDMVWMFVPSNLMLKCDPQYRGWGLVGCLSHGADPSWMAWCCPHLTSSCSVRGSWLFKNAGTSFLSLFLPPSLAMWHVCSLSAFHHE